MFILLKIVLFFIRPTVWVCALLVIGLSKRNPQIKIFFFKIGTIVFLFFSNPMVIRNLIQSYQAKQDQPLAASSYTAGIVLGGFVSYNLKEDKGYFNAASDRFIQTALLYKTGRIGKIIIAAGNGYLVKHTFNEAAFIKQTLKNIGIPDSVVFTDPDSRNTLENAINSKRIIDSIHLSGPFLLISSALHLPRALHVFRKKGMDVVAYPCDYFSENVGNNFWEDYILPSASALKMWDVLLKEVCGLTLMKIGG
ncbi:MAG: hypothetical protein NVS9B7_16220 [Flavisolibacter sp.]